jgi:hypothetical protein
VTRARDIADQQDNLGGAVPPFAAGKNKIINGDFGVWQRGTSFTYTAATNYTADRFTVASGVGGTVVVTQQAFTPGTAPVAGYEGAFFLNANYTASGTSVSDTGQYIEDVRTFAGQTITVSIWARVSSGTHQITPQAVQRFGTGGSSAGATNGANWILTTEWQRFSSTINVPSVAGKTIGAGSSCQIRFESGTSGVKSFSFWGLQAEAGTVATPFQTASGSIGGELALCQRYCEKSYEQATAPGAATGVGSQLATTGNISASSSSTMDGQIFFKVTKRSAPTVTLYDPAGNINKVRRTAIASANYDNLAASVDLSSENGFYVRSATSPAATQTMSLHYLATSEL